jgi:hypothetical protein
LQLYAEVRWFALEVVYLEDDNNFNLKNSKKFTAYST